MSDFQGSSPVIKVLAAVWIAVLSLSLAIIILLHHESRVDFVAFYCAGRTVTQHADPYKQSPLHACEEGITEKGIFGTNVTVPAPLPPYALVPYAAVSLVDFRTAVLLFVGASFLATAIACILCARMTNAPLLLVVALSAPTVWDNWLKGQPVPISFLAIVLSGYFLTKGRDRSAALAALGSLIQPQIGLAVCASLFLWRPRSRMLLTVSGALLIAVSIAAVSLPTAVEYVSEVLPLHAQSEARWITQISAVSPLVLFGVPVRTALTIAFAQQTVTTVFGILVAGLFARERRAVEMIAWFPALAAALGGTYEHGNVLLVVLPAALVIARIVGTPAAYAALCGALMTWPFLPDFTMPMFIGLSLFTIAVLGGMRFYQAFLAPVGIVLVAAAYAQLNHGLLPAPSGIQVLGAAYAEISWSQFVDAVNPLLSAQMAAFTLKLPAWLGLGGLFWLAAKRALPRRVTHGTG